MVGYCLTILDESAVWQLSFILYTRLQTDERKFLAVAALSALTDDEYRSVLEFMEDGT